MRVNLRLTGVALMVGVGGFLVGSAIGAPQYNNCQDKCWEGELYYTTATYCDWFSATQAVPNIRCQGSCFTGNPTDDEGTLTHRVGQCDNDCSNNIPVGVPREGANFHDHFMEFQNETIRKCPRS